MMDAKAALLDAFDNHHSPSVIQRRLKVLDGAATNFYFEKYQYHTKPKNFKVCCTLTRMVIRCNRTCVTQDSSPYKILWHEVRTKEDVDKILANEEHRVKNWFKP